MLGVGGGGLLVPLLALIFSYQGFEQDYVVHYALGTAFACMILSSLSSIRAHSKYGNVLWNLFVALSSGIILGTFVTAQIASQIPSTYIALFFSAFMALIAIQMFLNWQPKPSSMPPQAWYVALVGVFIGAISAVAAVGGGFLTTTYLNYKNIAMKKAIGTSAAIGLPISVSGTVGYMIGGWSETAFHAYSFGFIYLPAFLAISLTSVLAVPVGASFAQRLPDASLKRAFAVICLALSLKMLAEVI